MPDIHERSGATCGALRVHATLRRRDHHLSRKRVERLMREAGLQGAYLRKKWRTASTRQDPRHEPAPDLVNRDFTAPALNRLWVADATRIPCGQGAFWLAAVRDAFWQLHRRVALLGPLRHRSPTSTAGTTPNASRPAEPAPAR